MIKNSHAEVPIVILVMGVIFLCVLTFVNFEFFSFGQEKYFDLNRIGEIEQCLVPIEQYYFYKNLGYSSEAAKDKVLLNKMENFIGDKFSIDSQNMLICNIKGIKIEYSLE